MEEMSILKTLKRCELFLGLDDSDILSVMNLPSCKVKEYADQEMIFQEGEPANHLCVVADGKINLIQKLPVSSSQPGGKTVLRAITKGGVFGWSSMVPPHIYLLSAVSSGLSTILCIGGNELRALFDKDARLGYEVMKSLVNIVSSRVWNIEKLLTTGKGSPFI